METQKGVPNNFLGEVPQELQEVQNEWSLEAKSKYMGGGEKLQVFLVSQDQSRRQ